MRARSSLAIAALAAGLLTAVPSTSQAAHHLWRLRQLFTNNTGSVQAVSLFVGDAGETNIGAHGLAVAGHTFSFVNNLPAGSNTVNTWLLVATANFAAQSGGITPDYILPPNFLPLAGGTLTYATPVVDTWIYPALPTDGRNALVRDQQGMNVMVTTNSMVNFAGQTSSVVVPPTPIPATTRTGIVLMVGALLLAGSGLLRFRGRGRRLAV
jgi:hypothetical protein